MQKFLTKVANLRQRRLFSRKEKLAALERSFERRAEREREEEAEQEDAAVEDVDLFLTEKADAPIETIDVTYPVRPPFQFAKIKYDADLMELVYTPIDVTLTEQEKENLNAISLLLDNIRLDPAILLKGKEEHLREKVVEIIEKYGIELKRFQREKVLYCLLKDFTGYGPIEVPMNDRYIEDINCDGPGVPLYIYHRIFESVRTTVCIDELELNRFVLRLAQLCGKYISISQPITDASLPDGSRINLTLAKEVTRKGSTFSIRRFKQVPISPVELLKYGSVSAEQLAFFWLLLQYNKSILVSGSTAAGKTTLLNALCMFLKNSAKVVSIEDTPEINIYHSNWIQAVTRVGFGRVAGVGSASSGLESGLSGFFGILKRPGDIVLYDLLVAALRQRPDYILVGEVRGEEAYTMFQAISIGHPSLGTIHSGSLLELLARVESRPMSVPRPLLASLDCVAFTAIVSSDSESDSESRRKVRKAREVVEILDLNLKTNELRTNVVFSWDSQTDRFIFKKSFLFDSIERDFGVKTGLLREEMQRRAALLDRLCRLGITDYKEVTRAIQSYYLRPDETYEKFLKKSDEARVV
ncbi:type VI secretion protein [ANME-1 cluster archaeon ex4572_4]|mgnify:CR=1 FL=1|nr:type II/IV secretion system ATPase subunit [Methanophagales archaeon]OYT67035.1 MAG: type VI secretion protein [ANME-1 cluster archaeon ex4572_4]HDN68529.1 type VI secretion protein [Methanomicrobia archaeon]